jgi:hypothetical protein
MDELILLKNLVRLFDPPGRRRGRQALEPEIGTVQQLPLHLLSGGQVQRGR